MKKQWKYNEFIHELNKNGYTYLRKGKGSHIIFANKNGDIVSIPKGSKNINRMMAKRLIKNCEGDNEYE